MGPYAEWADHVCEKFKKWASDENAPLKVKTGFWSINVTHRHGHEGHLFRVKPNSTYDEDDDMIYSIGVNVWMYKPGEQVSKTKWVFNTKTHGGNIDRLMYEKIRDAILDLD